MIHPVLQPHGSQRLLGQLPPLGARDARVHERELDVLQRRGTREKVERLEDEAVGRSRQPMMFISVDLPDPDGPMIATYSPGVMIRSMPRSA
jgi:hypothetical protein